MVTPSRLPLSSVLDVSAAALVDQFLAEQQSLTAVERFSSRHDGGTPADSLVENRSFYRDLIPLREPAPGEQYAFEVDLDRCTGCKACVTACHNLNGLDEDETWRSVGVLQRASAHENPRPVAHTLKPVQQHVTTACHHCADPGCAQGCPTLAYEKDPASGVVRHLDDQCFGCQYCILKCPYDVPQYNARRGIVRKCDLCIGRLREGEAPACAQACPTQAIRVSLVETAAVRRDPAAAFDLPDVPDPGRVHPTTRYVTRRGLPLGMEAADASQIRAEHAHHPLTAMLVASQAAAGYGVIIALAALTATARPDAVLESPPFPWLALLGALGVHAALGLSLLHLGRPWLAWKAVLGWRRSWLSREVLAFSALAGSTSLYALVKAEEWYWEWESVVPEGAGKAVAAGVLFSALAAVYASAMVYRDTPRALWATRATLWRFMLTSALCGIPAWLLALQLTAMFTGLESASPFPPRGLWLALPFLTMLKLMLESSVLRHRDDGAGPLWKTAHLLLGPLRGVRALRITFGVLGGIVLPPVLAGVLDFGLPGPAVLGTALALLLITAGELLERHLFFVTAVAPRMPGGRK